MKFVQVLRFVQVGVFKLRCSSWGVQAGVFKFVRSSWGVQVGAFCEFLFSILRWSKSPHHVKVIHSWRCLNPFMMTVMFSQLPSAKLLEEKLALLCHISLLGEEREKTSIRSEVQPMKFSLRSAHKWMLLYKRCQVLFAG
jgi:hypothetical protein